MTQLDRAFIKAFRQGATTPPPLPARPTTTAPLAPLVEAAPEVAEPVKARGAKKASKPTVEQPAVAAPVVTQTIVAPSVVAESAVVQIASSSTAKASTRATAPAKPVAAPEPIVAAQVAADVISTKSSATPLADPPAFEQAVPASSRRKAATSEVTSAAALVLAAPVDEPATLPMPEPVVAAPAPAKSAAKPLSAYVPPDSNSAAGEDAFRPLLEVDAFAWPPAVDRLLGYAHQELAQFAAEIASRHKQRGQRVVGLCGHHRGEGQTTVLLCLAKMMAEQGLHCALIDADGENPSLASQLGISIPTGWETVAHGDLPLAEVLIASLQDRASLVPLVAKVPVAEISAHRTSVMFRTLRDHYDLLLIDLGAAESEDNWQRLAAVNEAARIDGVYMVHDVRRGDPAELADTARRGLEEGLPVCGVVENFTRQPAPATDDESGSVVSMQMASET